MSSSSFLLYAVVLLAGTGSAGTASRGSGGCETLPAGAKSISSKYFSDFTVVRQLTLIRGDSSSHFGTQTETLTTGRFEGRPALLDVLVFDTPRARTVDSSWVDPETLKPFRFQSDNAARTVRLDFAADRVRGQTTPADSAPTFLDRRLGVAPFEWNVLALAVSALPLEQGYCARLPVYTDRLDRVSWYEVRVVGDTSIERKSRGPEAVWEVVAQPDSAAPQARYWISRKHRVVSRVLVSEPGISILYARD
jgi:hypothetical protein